MSIFTILFVILLIGWLLRLGLTAITRLSEARWPTFWGRQIVNLGEGLGVDGDQVARAPEELQLAGRYPRRVVLDAHGVQDAEGVARVLVELGSLMPARDVFEC